MTTPYEVFCDAAYERTRVRACSAMRLRADCPCCSKKHKLVASPGRGTAVFTPHCGCDKNAVLDALGLDWPDLFSDAAYVAKDIRERPADLVMRFVTTAQMVLPIHRFPGEDYETAVATFLFQITLAARFRAQSAGLPHAFDIVPFTDPWVTRLSRRFGISLTTRQVRRVGRIGRALNDQHGGYVSEAHAGFIPVFRVSLRSAFSTTAHATGIMLLYAREKSRALYGVLEAFSEALDRLKPPSTGPPEALIVSAS